MTSYTLRSLLKERPPKEILEVCARWGCGGHAADAQAACGALAASMSDEQRVDARLRELPKKLADVFGKLLETPARMLTAQELAQKINGAVGSRYELDAALAALHREGFIWPTRARDWQSFGNGGWVVPGELADCIEAMREREHSELKELLSLQGFLARRHFRGSKEERPERADHARKIYKMYLLPGAIDGRIRHLPARVREVLELALVRHGGLLPLDELGKHEQLVADPELLRKCLEEQLLGTVAELPLQRVGLMPLAAVVLFHETTLHCLPAWSQAHPPAPQQALVTGVDLVTNLSRFLRELDGGAVQFTAEGQIYKASQKRIAKAMLPLPGGFLDGEALVAWLYRFSLQRRLVDRRGARALGLTETGHAFEQQGLHERLRNLLAFAVEDRELPGEGYHQVRLRRILLRLLKRTRPEEWHEALFLPFLARSTYLTTLDAGNAREFFAARFHAGGYLPAETPQQLCWNLLTFVKKRLFPLGLVDLGLGDGRPVALRLSKLGHELLAQEPTGKIGGDRSTLIVNPDFEVLLFPGDDLHDAIFALDRFAERTKSDHVHHFRLTQDSILAGLRDGLTVGLILQELTDRARVPLPQNVAYTLGDWANR